MNATVLFKNWLIGKFKAFLRKIMSMKPGGSSAGKYGSKKRVVIKKKVDVDEWGREVSGSLIYKVMDSDGNVLMESSDISEVNHWSNENKDRYALLP